MTCSWVYLFILSSPFYIARRFNALFSCLFLPFPYNLISGDRLASTLDVHSPDHLDVAAKVTNKAHNLGINSSTSGQSVGRDCRWRPTT